MYTLLLHNDKYLLLNEAGTITGEVKPSWYIGPGMEVTQEEAEDLIKVTLITRKRQIAIVGASIGAFGLSMHALQQTLERAADTLSTHVYTINRPVVPELPTLRSEVVRTVEDYNPQPWKQRREKSNYKSKRKR